ncbi:tRNA pseudouridine(55) synthase TruB [Arcanobacterium hippocoleae]|uniref:tRNA pseudouridine(55) synthase TruB n=1 Tax=Arcanobacterium hippocoleae TaxID=149017 RepID=UPI00333F2F73
MKRSPGQEYQRRIMPWGDLPRAEKAAPSGLILIDKDQGVTSHDVVGAMRRLAGTRKVGHGGTLDPMATGLLTIGIGRATKLLTYLSGCEKTYRATICLGANTNTEDADGEIIMPDAAARSNLSTLSAAVIDREIAALTGEIMQVPASFSALKVNGKRAHELARAGIHVELAARKVRISRFVRLSEPKVNTELFEFPVVVFDVEVSCSAGTYIRSLARDLGAALQVGAHLRMLRRIKVRSWSVDAAKSVAQCGDIVAARKVLPMISLADCCRMLFPRISVTAEEARLLGSGQFIPYRRSVLPSELGDGLLDPKLESYAVTQEVPKVVAAFTDAGEVVSLLSRRGRYYKPDLQLADA